MSIPSFFVIKNLLSSRDSFEKDGNIETAELLHNVFIKISKKKKKSKGKNVPNNPSLWAQCKSQAKQKFDVYPCVPLDSMALTKKGWAEYCDLSIGDEILTYNQSKNKLEWKPLTDLHFYENAPTLSLRKLQTNFKIRCTPDHKWVLKTPNVKYSDNFIDLLPGKHQIEIHYSDSKIELNDFNFYWR